MNRTLRLGLVLLALALIMSIGIALAAGLLRNDRNEPEAFPLAGSIARCEPTMPDGVVLLVRGFGAGEDWPDAPELTVYDDGLAVIGPSAEWGGSANTLEASWSQRRLGCSDAEGTISVTVVGLLPHGPDCMTDEFGAPSPTPVPAASAPAAESAPLTDACDCVPAALVGDLIGPIQGETEHFPDWSADWAFCWYPVEQDGLAITASRRSFPSERAAEQAISLFGEEAFSTEQVAGHDVHFNACDRSDRKCRAAVAISAEPHFVVVIWQGGSQAMLRELAERVIQGLAAAGQQPTPN